MVSYKQRAVNDLDRLLRVLSKWNPNPKEKTPIMTFDEVFYYIDDLKTQIETIIPTLNIHLRPTHYDHFKYGTYVASYTRKTTSESIGKVELKTVWYFIYDIDKYGNFLIKKIINNHFTNKKVKTNKK